MDYEKTYKEALELARQYYGPGQNEFLDTIFPELTESEDERIRKGLLAAFRRSDKEFWSDDELPVKDIIAYLEKLKDLFEYYDWNDYKDKPVEIWNAYIHGKAVGLERGRNAVKNNPGDYGLEKQKEQKPNVIIPKFRVGDMVISTKNPSLTYKVLEIGHINELNYPEYKVEIFTDGKADKPSNIKYIEIRHMDDWGELIKPQPAVWSEDYGEEDLRTRFAFYTYKDEDDALYLSNVFVEEASRNKGFGAKILKAAEKVAEIIGASRICLKVKQNTPENAWYRKNGYGYMTFEDGYDWLEKRLEYLKPKQEWSEEDEIYREWILECLADGARKVPEYAEQYQSAYDWLKSLRPHWKPSEQQIAFLGTAIEEFQQQNRQIAVKHLISLLNDLKNL